MEKTGSGARAPSTWRPDIDGLRAVAILSVVGYHFFPHVFLGGFVGVDIFFVISGFLITRILVEEVSAGTFSVLSFYARRVRRLFPALALVLAAVLAAGWSWLRPDEYAQLGAHTASGAAFAANLLLWRESGYFDIALEAKPLAHLWSLGIEEQFYIAWPLLLWFLREHRHRLRIVAVVFLVSLLSGVEMLRHDAVAAFYLPVFRVWELLAGALLALAAHRAGGDWPPARPALLSVAGFGLLVLGIGLIHSASEFPGWWALLPVSGAGLVIAAGPQARWNQVLLGNRAMVWFGNISYPLYLWHWPLLALARILFNADPRPEGLLLLFVLAVLLSWGTWKLVETPLRTGAHARQKVAVLAGLMAVLGGAGVLLAQRGGHGGDGPRVALTAGRFQEQTPELLDDCRLARPDLRHLVRGCARDPRGTERFALVGDSKADALLNGLVRTSSEAGRWLFIGGALPHTQVIPLLTDAAGYARHQPGLRLALDTVAVNPNVETVVVAAATRALFNLKSEDSIEDLPASLHYAVARDGLSRFTAELLRAGKKVVLVVDNPTLPDPGKCLTKARLVPPEPLASWFAVVAPKPGCRLALARHRELSGQYLRLLGEVRQMAPGRIAIFDTVPHLCDEHSGFCTSADGKGVLYSYTDHVSDYAAAKLGTVLNRTLAAGPREAGALRRARAPAPE